MMTALLALSIIDLALGVGCLVVLAKIAAKKPPTYPDPDAIARAILRSPFDAVDVREAMDVARDHHLVQHTKAGVTKVLYDGRDSNKAYDAHREMELNPNQYPGRHEYKRNGVTVVDRLHSEIEL